MDRVAQHAARALTASLQATTALSSVTPSTCRRAASRWTPTACEPPVPVPSPRPALALVDPPSDALDLNERVAAWQSGDGDARDAVLLEVRTRVVRYLAAQRLPWSDCEDVAQDVCLGVVDAVRTWRDEGRSFWGLVFAIARNKQVDRVRRTARQPQPMHDPERVERSLALVPAATPTPEDAVLALDGNDRVTALLGLLPRNQRDVVLLRVVVGLSVAETAHALQLAHGSVHVLQHRALRRLRTLLTEGPAR